MLLTSKLALFSRRIFADNARVNERLHELYEQNKRTPQQQNSVSFFCKQCNPTPMNVRSEPHKYYFPQNNSTFSIDITIGPCAATVAVLIFPPSLPITYFMPSPSPNPSVPPARCSRFVSAPEMAASLRVFTEYFVFLYVLGAYLTTASTRPLLRRDRNTYSTPFSALAVIYMTNAAFLFYEVKQKCVVVVFNFFITQPYQSKTLSYVFPYIKKTTNIQQKKQRKLSYIADFQTYSIFYKTFIRFYALFLICFLFNEYKFSYGRSA